MWVVIIHEKHHHEATKLIEKIKLNILNEIKCIYLLTYLIYLNCTCPWKTSQMVKKIILIKNNNLNQIKL